MEEVPTGTRSRLFELLDNAGVEVGLSPRSEHEAVIWCRCGRYIPKGFIGATAGCSLALRYKGDIDPQDSVSSIVWVLPGFEEAGHDISRVRLTSDREPVGGPRLSRDVWVCCRPSSMSERCEYCPSAQAIKDEDLW